MKLLPRSLQGRLAALAALATLVALVAAAFGIGQVLERFVMQGLDQRLDARLALLGQAVRPDGSIDRDLVGRVDRALGRDRGWTWRIDAPGGTLASGAQEVDPDGPPLPPPGEHRRGHDRDDHDDGRPFEARSADGSRLHGRRLDIATSAGVASVTAAAPRAIVERPIRAAMVPLVASLAILGLLLAMATLIQLRVGLRPLRRLRDQVAAIRAGRSEAVPDDQPDELRPLAAELNALAADNRAALAVARASAANLAHGLKTPIATLGLALREAGRDPDGELSAQVARIEETVRHHLGRARSATAETRATTAVEPALEGLVAAIARIHADRGIAISVEVTAGLAAAIAPQDFDELAGNLIDNAVRHAAAAVHVVAGFKGGLVRLSVADDGPGIAPAYRARATAPGARLDESGDGHGFGLSIVRDLAALYGGALTLDEAPGGGLAATVTLRPALAAA